MSLWVCVLLEHLGITTVSPLLILQLPYVQLMLLCPLLLRDSSQGIVLRPRDTGWYRSSKLSLSSLAVCDGMVTMLGSDNQRGLSVGDCVWRVSSLGVSCVFTEI